MTERNETGYIRWENLTDSKGFMERIHTDSDLLMKILDDTLIIGQQKIKGFYFEAYTQIDIDDRGNITTEFLIFDA